MVNVPAFISATRGKTCLLAMELCRDTDRGGYDLILRLSPDGKNGPSDVTLRFCEVGQLRVNQFGEGLTQILLLNVEDLSANQLERIRYRVTELENDSIAFTCRDMSIETE